MELKCQQTPSQVKCYRAAFCQPYFMTIFTPGLGPNSIPTVYIGIPESLYPLPGLPYPHISLVWRKFSQVGSTCSRSSEIIICWSMSTSQITSKVKDFRCFGLWCFQLPSLARPASLSILLFFSFFYFLLFLARPRDIWHV